MLIDFRFGTFAALCVGGGSRRCQTNRPISDGIFEQQKFALK